MRRAVRQKGRSKEFDYAGLFTALGDRTRLRLLNLLSGGEVCVCHLVDVLGESQPKISRHLAYLRRAEVVSARREGKWMHYSLCPLDDKGGAAILAAVVRSLRESAEMQNDMKQLRKVCC
jgi:ArsR family transcriptional regulator